jgi:hypothetical protein
MKILSFDIGIVNMAYCLMETDAEKRVRILDWQVMNIAGIPDCSMCKKRAKCYVLLSHHKDPSAVSYYCSAHNKSYVEKHFQKKDVVGIKDTKDMDLDYLGAILYNQLEQRVQLFDNLDAVLFENQPVLKNPKMKSIQMMLYSYFLYKKTLCNCAITTLKFYTAKKKLEIKGVSLDVSTFDKKDYKDRKTLGKLICKEILKKMQDFENIQKLEDKTKQDDLCDCFVQGIEYLQTQGAFTLDSN